jgi:VCBS repeat-containing protein
VGYNISDVSGHGTGTTQDGQDGWVFTADLADDPGTTVVTGNFNVVSNGVSQGEANSYSFSALSTTQFGTLSVNTSNGQFVFTINHSALYASGSDQTVTFTVTGSGGSLQSDSDTVSLRLLICIVRGTLVDTPTGKVPVERLAVGDLVATAGSGDQPIRWIGSRRVTAPELTTRPELLPIRIAAGALAGGAPDRDLLVSPQHRVLVRGWAAELFFGSPELLVPAKALVNGTTITTDVATREVEYFHMLFDQHEIIVTEGAETESFHPGRQAV